MTQLLDHNYSEVISLIEFTWGPVEDDRKYSARYTDVEEDVTVAGNVYLGSPVCGLEIPELAAGLDIITSKVTLPLIDGTFTDDISDGFPHAIVRCRIMELHSRPSPQWPRTAGQLEQRQNKLVHLFQGLVSNAIKNPKGRSSLVELEIASPMLELEHKALGIPANAECAHTHFGQGCFLDLFDVTHWLYPMYEDTSITGINGNVISMHPNSTRVHTMPEPGWLEGYVDVEGCRIKIVNATKGSLDITLIDPPSPRRWLNQNCRIVAGCGLTHGDCQFYRNEKNFGAYGWAIPSFNPLFEAQ
jgi:hypothetical protein